MLDSEIRKYRIDRIRPVGELEQPEMSAESIVEDHTTALLYLTLKHVSLQSGHPGRRPYERPPDDAVSLCSDFCFKFWEKVSSHWSESSSWAANCCVFRVTVISQLVGTLSTVSVNLPLMMKGDCITRLTLALQARKETIADWEATVDKGVSHRRRGKEAITRSTSDTANWSAQRKTDRKAKRSVAD
eukprot:g72240.t1